MVSKIVKYIAVVGLTLIGSSAIKGCYRNMQYSGLQPANGFPAWDHSRNMRVEQVKNNGTLETYLTDGEERIPIYERSGMFPFTTDLCSRMTVEEDKLCHEKFSETHAGTGITGVVDDLYQKGASLVQDAIEGISNMLK